MKKCGTIPLRNSGESGQRIVLLIDGDAWFVETLRRAWSQLHLADELHVVSSREEALDFLIGASAKKGAALIAAVVLDPDATGEETGAFLRELRRHCGKAKKVPTVFWTRDGQKYEVLEGRGVESVLKKPKVLQLIQALDTACQLRVQYFSPFPGSSIPTEWKAD